MIGEVKSKLDLRIKCLELAMGCIGMVVQNASQTVLPMGKMDIIDRAAGFEAYVTNGIELPDVDLGANPYMEIIKTAMSRNWGNITAGTTENTANNETIQS